VADDLGATGEPTVPDPFIEELDGVEGTPENVPPLGGNAE
jgi:hypothetical protein